MRPILVHEMIDMYLGCAVYLFSAHAQNRFLTECLAPLADELLKARLRGKFVCDRNDLRGPHINVIFGVIPGRRDELRLRMEDAVAQHLSRVPCTTPPAESEILARHDACSAKFLTIADRALGIAHNNTYCVFDHEERGYPFVLTEKMQWEQEEVFWQLHENLVLWSLGELASGCGSVAAVRWVAALDRASVCNLERASSWFGFVVNRLAPQLARKVRSGEVSSSALMALVGRANATNFSQIFVASHARFGAVPDLKPLMRFFNGDDESLFENGQSLQYDIVRSILQILGLNVREEVPLLVYAWANALERERVRDEELS